MHANIKIGYQIHLHFYVQWCSNAFDKILWIDVFDGVFFGNHRFSHTAQALDKIGETFYS